MKVEWWVNIKSFVDEAIEKSRSGKVITVYEVIDNFCVENECVQTPFNTMICDEERLIMIKLARPELVSAIYTLPPSKNPLYEYKK